MHSSETSSPRRRRDGIHGRRGARILGFAAFLLVACSKEDGREESTDASGGVDAVDLVRVLEADEAFPPVPHHPPQIYELPEDASGWVDRFLEKLRRARTKEALVFARETLSEMGESARAGLEVAILSHLHRSDSDALAFLTNAVHCLALDPDPANAPLLLRVLEHPLPNVRRLALQGLELPAEFEVVRPLFRRVEALGDDPHSTVLMVDALRRLRQRRLPGTQVSSFLEEIAMARLRTVRHPNLQHEEGLKMITKLAACPDERVGELFERMIRDDRYRSYHRQIVDVSPLLADRERALAILGFALSPEREDRPYVRPLARRALAVLGDETTLAGYRERIGREGRARPSPDERRGHMQFWVDWCRSAWPLARTFPKGSWLRQLGALGLERKKAVSEAFLALGMAGRAEELAPFLTIEDPDLRASAWNALGFAWRRQGGAFPPDEWPADPLEIEVGEGWRRRFEAGLLDPDERVRWEAARQCVLVGEEAPLAVYRDVLREGETHRVRDVLGTLVRARPREMRWVPELLERLAEAPESDRFLYLQALAPLARPEDHPALLPLLTTDEVWAGRPVAPVAASLFRDLGRDAVPALVELAGRTRDPRKRIDIARTIAAAAVKDSRTGRVIHPRWTQELSIAARYLLEELAFDPREAPLLRLELLQQAPFIGGTAVASLLHERFLADGVGPRERSWLHLILDDYF